MDSKELQSILRNLHAELGSAESVDAESREMLQQIARDIEKIAAAPEPVAEEHASVTRQLEDAALKFESEHPKLSQVLGDIMDALGKLGI